ncbi:xanthine dehydrogenase family protein subunit M [Roseomonas eburnea]|uniref:Xanthine dehydrogenase family protein subunit M n=1 Tax=Neoroseomonas eburnea TaxID=1346889 RepID=A0A9X9XEA7_9PROT|nr:FAD binding domain-containing protein [Neoroseomonas eburnea]MBR0682043.1 xanthine dehydrogenase family protein subunit M [Neoroseomonas eburnea]
MTAYHRPRTLHDALAIRAATGALPLAGGTDIHPLRTARAAWGDPWRPEILDLSAVPGLDGIEESAEGWRIGARTTWTTIAEAPLPPLFDGLRAAAREIGGRQVQNRGTIAGNLVTASPAGDGIPNLLALDAEVELATATGTRRLPVGAFLTGYRATALAAGEIVTALRVPRCDGARGRFAKLGARRYLVISIAMAAGVIRMEGDRIAEARIAVGACSPVARRLPTLEEALIGLHPSEMPRVPQPAHLAPLAPIGDVRATAAYRADAAVVLLRDLLAGFAR